VFCASATSTEVRRTYVRLLRDRQAVDALTTTRDHVVIDRAGQVAAEGERRPL
jgi:hypothetical protein